MRYLRLLLLLTLFSPAYSFDLTRDGKPLATIVVPDDTLPVVKAAAEELQYHVRRASGATLPIVAEGTAPAGPGLVYLGPCKATLATPIPPLSPNAFLVRNVGGNLYLCGDDSAGEPFWILHGNRTRVGTLFAVYHLLDTCMGIRWLWPGPLGEVIPANANVTARIPEGVVKPTFVHTRWRDGGMYSSNLKGWADPKVRSLYLNEQGKFLRRHRFAMGVNMDMAHAYTNWWERFGATHPEYFNLLPDGTRRSDTLYHGGAPSLISMSVGEPGFVRQKIADWAATRTPDKPHVDASENDTPGKCVCEKCLALDEPDPDNPVPFADRAKEAEKRFRAGDPAWYEALGSLSDRYARCYLALQKEAEKVDPQAVVMGYSYANYVKPPLKTKLNDRIIIGIVPALMYPWTKEKRQAFHDQWQGWAATGARLFLRPNYMLDGHNLPINFARALGEDFSFAASHGLIGTDFDSLTGQWAAQGLNLYMLARLHDCPTLPVQKVMDEYYAAFGPAANAVKAYFDHWEQVSSQARDEKYTVMDQVAANRGPLLHWSYFYRNGDLIFTPAVMAQGRALMDKALVAAKGAGEAEARTVFLDHGLTNAELTLAVQRAYRDYKAKGLIEPYVAALQKLDDFRAKHEGEYIGNMAYLAWAESRDWDRDLIKLMATPGTRLPDPWKFMWEAPDTPASGDAVPAWAKVDFDDSKWYSISTGAAWEEQEVGKQYRTANKRDFDGFAWYRTTFTVPKPEKPSQVRLIFGAVDESCIIWLNGKEIHRRPYPFNGDTDSWKQAFEVEITDTVRFDAPNVLAVRVQDTAGAGGIWKPVWLTVSEAPALGAENAIPDGGFEADPTPWKQNAMAGKYRFALDTTQKRNGRTSGLLECQELGTPEVQAKMGTRAWARWYQTGLKLEPGKTYTLRVWYRTSDDFAGAVKLWVRGAKGTTQETKGLSTQGIWRELTATGFTQGEQDASVYLNTTDSVGKVWFDDVQLVADK